MIVLPHIPMFLGQSLYKKNLLSSLHLMPTEREVGWEAGSLCQPGATTSLLNLQSPLAFSLCSGQLWQSLGAPGGQDWHQRQRLPFPSGDSCPLFAAFVLPVQTWEPQTLKYFEV